MGNRIEEYTQHLTRIERSVDALEGAFANRKISASAHNEASALFKGLLHSLEDVCQEIALQNGTFSQTSYEKIEAIYAKMQQSGKKFSVQTDEVGKQLHLLRDRVT